MKRQRTRVKLLALLGGGAMALAACSTGSSSSSSSSTAEAPPIKVAQEQEFSAYNNTTAGNNATKNAVVLDQVQPSLWQWGPDGEVQQVKDFGSYAKTSDNPLTVEYKLNPKAVWSDGSPMGCSDFVLQWAAQSNKFPAAGFSPASTTGFERMQQPQCKAGDTDIKVVYDQPYADWQTGFGGPGDNLMPAHIVEKQTGVASVIDAVTSKNAADLAKIAKFWNDGWSFSPGQLKKDIIPSSGPYLIDSWQAGQSLTLKANPKWWGTPPKTKTIVYRFIDQTGQAQALQNGDVQIAEPQPNPDVLNQLAKAGNDVTVLKGDTYSYEHLDFNFKGEFADANLRKAFALCVPRDQIVAKLINPVNPEAKPMDSRMIYPFQPAYPAVAKAVTDGTYAKANIPAAKQLMAGKTGVKVNIGYIAGNQRRADTVALIKASCDQAGFDVIDHSSPTFFDDGGGLNTGDFDVALFAWSGSSSVSPNAPIFSSTGGQNKGHYSNPQVDALMNQLQTATDKDAQTQIIEQADKIMWNDLATIPLFAWPGMAAYNSKVSGVVYQPSQSMIEWNMQNWVTKAS